jgi:hypothetical protein
MVVAVPPPAEERYECTIPYIAFSPRLQQKCLSISIDNLFFSLLISVAILSLLQQLDTSFVK